jgi:YD repeat-containing protein
MRFGYRELQIILSLPSSNNNRFRFCVKNGFSSCLMLLMQSLCVIGLAQIPSISDTTSTPIPNAGHDYIHAPSETVNPANGSLSIRIGVPVPPSRGFTVPFNFAYDSNGVFYLAPPPLQHSGFMWWDTTSSLSQGGWSYSVPMLSVQDSPFSLEVITPTGQTYPQTCDAWTNYVMQDAAGTRYNLGLTMFDNTIGCNQQQTEEGPVTTNQVGPILATTDPNWYNAGTVNPVDVIDADGTDYSFGSMQSPAGSTSPCSVPALCLGTIAANAITDRNGNRLSIITNVPGGGGAPNGPVLSYLDTIGRTVLNVPTFGASLDSITVSGFSQPYQVNWTSVTAKFPITMTNLPFTDTACSNSNGGEDQPNINAVSSIVLPNGQQYSFSYDATYGMVSKITYPTGGYVRYEWGLNSQAAFGDFPVWGSTEVAGPNGVLVPGPNQIIGACAYNYDTPAILHRYVSYDGNPDHEVERQDFTYTTSWNPPSTWGNGSGIGSWIQKQTTVATYDLTRGTQTSTVYTYVPSYQEWQPNAPGFQTMIPVESQVQYYDTDGTLLQTVGKQWGGEGRIITQQTTALNGLVSENDWGYDSNEMLTEKDDYDYGPGARGPLLRKTMIPSYHPFSTHIVDKPDSVLIKDGGGNLVSQVNNTQYDPVGNLLSSSRYITADGQSIATTSHTYDGSGNTISTTDPNGYVTGYSYADVFVDNCTHTTPASAYLTGITYPTVNGVTPTKSFQYFCASGSLANSTDENSQKTTYSYVDPTSGAPDPLNRLRQITYPVTPDGTTGGNAAGYTRYTYVDSPGALSLTEQDLQNASGAVIAKVTDFDGFGEVVTSQLLTPDQPGPVNVDTVYDGVGQIFSKSNPYRTKTDPTYGLTTYTYDGLGRIRLELEPDNISSLLWTYVGNTTKSTDENGNSWTRTTDALGRLTGVVEPNSSSTSYIYSGMGDLVTVKQPGLTGETPRANRSFTYDLLSRLICSSNPENSSAQCPLSPTTSLPSGVVGYSYDANGNMTSKTDARGITTGYAYDGLNRLTKKQYSGEGGVTPSSCYLYDTGSGTAVSNSIGRLVQEWTQNGPCSATAPATDKSTQRFILGYDAVGRILTEQRCILGNCKLSAVPFSMTTGYDLAGNLATYDNGLGTLTITNHYDTANRLFQVTGNINDATHPPSLYYISGFTPFGASISSMLGGNIPITQTYDVRLRPTGLSAVKQ